MPNRPVDKVYVTYKKKCKEIRVSPIEKTSFEKIFAKQKRVLTYMMDTLHRKEPYIISDIDKSTVLYTKVQSGQVTINVWTVTECEALTGIRNHD